jgi:tRNA A-37 threonylcarbamoyl transferase component Bud32
MGILLAIGRWAFAAPLYSAPPPPYKSAHVAASSLEQSLRDLPRIGTLIKDRGYRQVWRFEHEQRAYYLKFYPRKGVRDALRRLTRGSPARLEFERLQWLQRADVPAPRAVAALYGFRLDGQSGDAVVLHAIEPAVPLDAYLNDLELRGEEVENHLRLVADVCALIGRLAKAGLGHEDLHLGNILRKGDELFLIDAYAVQQGGLRLSDLLRLAHSVRRFATRTDLLRGWRLLGPGGGAGPMPPANRVSNRMWADLLRRVMAENRYFGRLEAGQWTGTFFRQEKYPRRWSDASRLTVEENDWLAAWPKLLAQIESGEVNVLKRSPSGDVLSAEVELGGQTVAVIVKRPRRRYWYRYINEIGRGPRSRRAWLKAWKMIVRDVPTAWPLLLMEKRQFGYVTDNLIVFERVAGPTLARADLDAMPTSQRQMLFRRIGRLLRSIDRLGFSHFDAKASNWIVRDDPQLGPGPVMIDVDGIRQRRWLALGIDRLLRSLASHRQYVPADSLALCQGYAPFSATAVETVIEKVVEGE